MVESEYSDTVLDSISSEFSRDHPNSGHFKRSEGAEETDQRKLAGGTTKS